METKVQALAEYFKDHRYNPETGEIFRHDKLQLTALPFRTPHGSLRRHYIAAYLATRDEGFLYAVLDNGHPNANGYGVALSDSSLPPPARYKASNIQLPAELQITGFASQGLWIPTATTISRVQPYRFRGHRHLLLTLNNAGFLIDIVRPVPLGPCITSRDADGKLQIEPLPSGDYRVTPDGTIHRLTPTTTTPTEDFL